MFAKGSTFQVSGIHQIEMTSRCNLRCKYCTHPTMARAKVDMTDEIYMQTLALVKRLLHTYPGVQHELNLAGIGESTLHPEFVRNVFLAREAVGEHVDLVIATNGLLMTKDLAREIAPARPRMFVSAHRPERAKLAIDNLHEVGLLAGISFDPSVNATDWAGQVKWKVTSNAKGTACPWVVRGWAIALSDGRLARCSFDSSGDPTDIIGTVFDEPETLRTSAYRLCATCHMDVGVALN